MSEKNLQHDVERFSDDQLKHVTGSDGNAETTHKVYKKGDRLWGVACRACLRPSRHICTDFRCDLCGCIYRLPEIAKTRGWDGTYAC